MRKSKEKLEQPLTGHSFLLPIVSLSSYILKPGANESQKTLNKCET